jgi:Flp pilus assembly protein TadG
VKGERHTAGVVVAYATEQLRERLGGDERGAMVVTSAIFIPAAIALMALVFDAGVAWRLKRHLQTSADAVAPAAAQDLPDDGADLCRS